MEEIEEPTLLQTVRAHTGEVTCVDAFGARLATGGGDRVLRLYEWERGSGWSETAIARAAHRYGVTAARYSPAAALLASAGVDGVLRGRRTLAAAGAVAARALCWVGSVRLLAGHDDGALYVWHVARASVLSRLAAHEGALYAIAAPAHGALLLTACTEGVLKVFDLVEVCQSEESKPPAPLLWVDGAHDLGAMAADAAADGMHAATGGHDAKIRIWRVHWTEGGCRSLQPASTLEGHTDSVTALRWAGAVLASSALDRTARLWLPRAGACLHVVHAHARYLTCIALSADLRYMVTGSNDKSVRMWSLGELTVDGELEPVCDPFAHFALGDLEGIGPVDEDALEDAGKGEDSKEDGGTECVWRCEAHTGPVNCIAVCGVLIATASSDGQVKIFRWDEESKLAMMERSLEAHEYPALACEFGAGGAVLLTAGIDGCAHLWDVQSGCLLRSLSVPAGGGGEAGGGGGGGGVRGARVSPHRPPLLLLATDDGLAPLMYGGHAEAATCCAWSGDGRALVTGAGSGELIVRSPPPAPRDLCVQQNAHEGDGSYLLASAGSDSLIKLWVIELDEEAVEANIKLACAVLAHGNGATCARWGVGGLLASTGFDQWARVWRVESNGTELCPVTAVPTGSAGGAPAVALLPGLLAVGSLTGELALWRLPEGDCALDSDDAELPRFWGEEGVARWLHEYIVRVPGVPGALGPELEVQLIKCAREASVTGARLLDDPVDELLAIFGYGPEESERDVADVAEVRTRFVDELHWLREPPPPARLVSVLFRSESGERLNFSERKRSRRADLRNEKCHESRILIPNRVFISPRRLEVGDIGREAGGSRLPPRSKEPEERGEGRRIFSPEAKITHKYWDGRAWTAPHSLLCPESHALLAGAGAAGPVRAPDARTRARAAHHERALAAPAPARAPAPAPGRAPRRIAPNYRLAAALRAYLRLQQPYT
ncbi:unnamed protein product [Diatraea saccharalis]|uniref:Uncharacterized protein n=1 Tax=Diatraea saccharalis TaxID=40085 RepID=A0A9N9WH90_9NEOP|nr:unnamed protein product [Diatraea saccharalis]